MSFQVSSEEQLTEVLLAFVVYCSDQVSIWEKNKNGFCVHHEHKMLSCWNCSASMQKCVSVWTLSYWQGENVYNTGLKEVQGFRSVMKGCEM